MISYYEWQKGATALGWGVTTNSDTPIHYDRIFHHSNNTVDVRRSNGIIDRFRIAACPESVLPVITDSRNTDKMSTIANNRTVEPTLATPKLALTYGGRPENHSHQRDSLTVSKLLKSKEGIIGQLTSDGCFLFELQGQGKEDEKIDLRPFLLLLPPTVIDEVSLERHTSLQTHCKFLATITGRNQINIYDLQRQRELAAIRLSGEKLRSDQGNGEEPFIQQICWLGTEQLAVLLGNKIVIVNIKSPNNEELYYWLNTGSTLIKTMAFLPSSAILLAIGEELSSQKPFILKFPFLKTVQCPSPTSMFACFYNEQQILRLRPPEMYLSRLRDHGLVWEYIDVPFMTMDYARSPIRLAVIDSTAKWLVIGWTTGFAIANLIERQWNLSPNNRESSGFCLQFACWINLPNRYTRGILATIVQHSNNRPAEFIVFDATLSLSLGKALYRQPVESRIIGLYDLGEGTLGIMLESCDLQVVQFTLPSSSSSIKPALEIHLVLRVSLGSVINEGEQCRLALLRGYNLLVISCELGLMAVSIPSQEEKNLLQSTTEIKAKLICPSKFNEFWVWKPLKESKMTWIVAPQDNNLTFYDLSCLTPMASFKAQLEFIPNAFYPNCRNGLILGIASNTSPIDASYKMQVTNSYSVIVMLLFYLIESENKNKDGISVINSILSEITLFHDRINILEALMLRIFQLKSCHEQEQIFARLQSIIIDQYKIPQYITIMAAFVRKIEISDALRIMEIMGPFKMLFSKAIDNHDLPSAFSFLRVQSAGPSLKEFLREPYTKLLRESYRQRQLAVFQGVIRMWEEFDFDRLAIQEIQSEIVSLRDWPYLEPLTEMQGWKGGRFAKVTREKAIAHALLYTDHNVEEIVKDTRRIDDLSLVTKMLMNLHLEEEAQIWSVVVDGIVPGDLDEEKLGSLFSLVERYHDIQ